MGFAVWGAETGIGRAGLTLYLASFIVPFIYGIITYFIINDLRIFVNNKKQARRPCGSKSNNRNNYRYVFMYGK